MPSGGGGTPKNWHLSSNMMKITPFPKIRLEKMSLQNEKTQTGRALFLDIFDKQGVDFTFLSLLPMEWINKQTKIRNTIYSRNVVVLASLKAHLNFYITVF